MDSTIEKGLTQLRKMPYYPLIQNKSKYALVDITLSIIAAAFEESSKRVPEMKQEIDQWDDGRKCAIGVLPNGPFINIEKKKKRIYYTGKGRKPADVTFLFKNLDSAVLVFTAQLSAHQAMAECRIMVDGNNAYAMEMNRALAIVETYLFPSIILKMIFKRPPKLTPTQLMTKSQIYPALVPALLKQLL